MNTTEVFRNTAIVFIILAIPVNFLYSYKKCPLKIRTTYKKNRTVYVEVADTSLIRQKGLMYRKYLKRNSGMLFIFDKEMMLRFWMKNTYIALSIAYINKKGVINEIYHMKPLDISITYPSKKPAKYALEVNRGWFKKNRIKPGSRINLNGCISK